MTHENRIAELESELATAYKLLEEKEKVLEAIPACPLHGSQCVPHALEWVETVMSFLNLTSRSEDDLHIS